jgi:hypothetical protein
MPAPPAFQFNIINVRPDQLIPRKHLSPMLKHSRKYRQIKASLETIGLIEPIVVFPKGNDQYLILDGHVRAAILTELAAPSVMCLVATEEEAYTYNKRVNALNSVQEHEMILKALKNGLSEERIAATLNVNVGEIRQKRDLLNGIAHEAAELLKTRNITAEAFKILKRMTPYRQIEAAELMIAAHNYTVNFAKAILAATKPEDLIQPANKHVSGIGREQASNMEEELADLQRDLTTIKYTYANDTLTLSITVKYLTGMLANEKVLQYFNKHHPDLLRELQDAIQQPSE